jgi:glycosyltransferase involved in cell wall biosynthesis
VVTVSPTYAEVLARRGARRTFIVTNSFDPEAYPPPQPIEPTMVYLGSYYPGRQDLETAVRAVGRVVASSCPGLRLRIVGVFPTGLSPVIERAGLAARTECTGFIPHGEALRELRRAAVLLLGGPVSCETAALRGHVAAKTFEYLGAQRPLLMIGDAASDVATLLRPLPHVRIVQPGEVDAAVSALQSLLKVEPEADASLTVFTTRELTASLARGLSEVCC